jgi:hypothetical protein
MEAPEGFESVPGLRDNALLAMALAEITGQPETPQLLNVARQLLQGHVFLRVKGDARALLAEGKDLPLAIATRGDEQLVLAYSSGQALTKSVEADGDRDTSAIVDGAPLWIAVNQTEEGGPVGVAESRSATGERFLEVFSHPLELLALGRGDQPVPLKVEQLAKALAGDEELTGLLVDPAGPWIRLSRAELAPVLALAE